MRLRDKIAIVTGAGKGIGKTIALTLGKEGANVIVNYAHSENGAQEVVRAIKKMGQKAICARADVSKADEVEAMVKLAVKHFGRIDILVNNAGIDPRIPFLKTTEEEWDKIIDINLKGTFLCSQRVTKEMLKTGKGKIIIISSVHGLATMTKYTAYAASKGGLNMMTKQLALELASYKVNVNAVAPGMIEVEKYLDVLPDYDRQAYGKRIPCGRVGLPEDVAKAVVFLASDEADFITGQVLYVDGGTTSQIIL